MRKCCAEIGAVDVRLACTFGEKQSVTSWTKYIDSVVSGEIRKSHRKHRLSLTKYTRTSPKGYCSIFLVHRMHTSVGDNISVGMMIFKKE
jgi:hypothetical protein